MRHAKWIVAGLAGVAIVIGLITLPIGETINSFLAWVEGLGAWGPILVSLAYIPATVFFVPGSALTLGAGALFGVVIGTAAVSVGSVAGSTAAFLVGRYLARDWVAKKVEGNTKFRAVDEAVGRSGFKIVLLTRLSPIFPYNLLGYMYGITRVKLSHYVLASWIGMLPGTVMYVYFGSLAGEVTKAATGAGGMGDEGDPQQGALKWVLYGVGFVATVVVTVIITRIASKAIRDEVPGATPDEDNNTTTEATHTKAEG